MRNILLLFMLLGLGLSSCEKKEESPTSEEKKMETLTIKGRTFSRAFLFNLMSQATGVDINLLTFDQKTEAFYRPGYDDPILVERYFILDSLKEN